MTTRIKKRPIVLVTSAEQVIVFRSSEAGRYELPQVARRPALAVAGVRDTLDGEISGLRELFPSVGSGEGGVLLSARLMGHAPGRWVTRPVETSAGSLSWVEVSLFDLERLLPQLPADHSVALSEVLAAPDPLDVLLGPVAATRPARIQTSEAVSPRA